MSFEERRSEWKAGKIPAEKEAVDKWFGEFSLDELESAFFESDSFDILVEKYIRNIRSMEEVQKMSDEMKKDGKVFNWELSKQMIGYTLGKIVLKTPSLLDMVHENKNVAKKLMDDILMVERRIFAILAYQTKGKGIPDEAYNFDQEWNSDSFNEQK